MLFKRTKNIEEKNVTPMALKKMAEGLNNRLHKCAEYLQKKTEHLSTQAKKLCLFLFCLLFGSVSICLIIKSFTDRENTLSIHAITVPAYVDKSNDYLLPEQTIISEKEFNRIEFFKHYMDSLQKSETGKYLYDSIMKERPHLIDSILLLENMCQAQSPKK